jgi:hypothetical protein
MCRVTRWLLFPLASEALCVGGYASADSAEGHGGTMGFARGAPLIGIFNSLISFDFVYYREQAG